VLAFTIEAGQTLQGTAPTSDKDFVVPRPIRGLMTNHGYMVADPVTPDRSTIWFSGGSIEVQDEVADAAVWKQIFDESVIPRRDMKAAANLLAAKILLERIPPRPRRIPMKMERTKRTALMHRA